MDIKKYFEKNGKVYGISDKYSFGEWIGYKIEFDSLDDAYSWLYTEEFDFRTKELVCKTRFDKCSYELFDKSLGVY